MRSLICILIGMTAIYGMSASGLNPNVFGNFSARSIGPAVMSGRITDIESPRADPDTLYVGTGGGGVWKSTNAGHTFKSVFDEYPQSIGCIKVDPQNPETVWAGTGEINTRNSVSYGKGLFKTTDGGKTWALMGFEDSERIAEIAIHPKNADVVYVAVLGHLWDDHEERGLYKTTDGGKTWNRILYVDEKTGCIDLDMDPQEPDVIYAAMWQVRRWPWYFESGGPGSGLYKSTDGGKSFQKLTKGLPEGNLGRIDLDIAPSRPNRLYAVVEAETTALYRSEDMGGSWEQVSTAFGIQARPFYLSIIKIDPKNADKIYNPSLFLTVSEDGGKSWPGLFSGFSVSVHPDNQAIWINPDNPKHLIIGTDGGLYISRDGAQSFAMAASLPVSQFYRVSVDDQHPYRIYGGLQDNGSWFAPSSSPTGIGNDHWVNVGNGDGASVWADGADPNFVYWERQGGVLHRLDLRVQENKYIVPFPGKGMNKNRFNWNSPLTRGANDKNTIYFGSQYLYRSRDMGDNWERISPDLTTDDPEKQRQEESGGLSPDVTTAENHCTIFYIAESPLDENMIWVGTDDGNVQLTRDGGKNWENAVENIPDLPKTTWCSSIRPSPHDKGTVFATFDGHRTGDKTPYLYRSDDYGKTWRSLITESIEGHCHIVLQDTVNPDLLFLGTEMGLYLSLDGGDQWAPFQNDLPSVSIRDMVIHERERDLVLGTHGRGIYILDDITPLRHLTPEALSSKVTILPSRPGRAINYRQVQSFPGANNFSAPNPAIGMHISYYQKSRHMFGDLHIEIYDENGTLVKTLEGGKGKGLNRVFWNMRMAPPKVPRASGLSIGAFFGPFVKEGDYTARLVKGEETHEVAMTLLPNPLNPHSKEDRALRFETSMKLYGMQEDVTFTADRLADLVTQCENRAEKLEKGGVFNQLKKRANELTTLREKLTAPNAGLFVTRERLQDQIVNLYAGVSEYSGRPSSYQLEEMEDLAQRLKSFAEEADPLMDVTSLNKLLQGKQQPALEPLNKEQWRKRNEQGSGPVPKSFAKLWYSHIAPVMRAYQLSP